MTRRHVLITGGGTGVGRAVALRFGRDGWAVSVVGRRVGPLEEVAGQLEHAFSASADVTDAASLDRATADAESALGPIYAVVANAGGTTSAPAHRTSVDAFRQTIELNLVGAFATVRSVLPKMIDRRSGRVVFVASTAGLKGYGYVAPYCAAKHGVVGLARSLAVELATKGITVNAVCPGYVETPMLAETITNITSKTGMSEEAARKKLLEAVPSGRFVSPEEVAGAISYLCSDDAASTTGHALTISGGEV